MKFEFKKLLSHKELWIVLALSLIALLLLTFRYDFAGFSVLKVTWQKQPHYYSMTYQEAEPILQKELAQLGPEAQNESSPKFAEATVLKDFQFCINEYKQQEDKMRELVIQMNKDLQEAQTDFARRDLSHALKLYNRAYHYRVCPYNRFLFAFLHMEYGDYLHWLYLLLIVTLLSPLFSAEYETGMYQILFSSKKGKKALFRKKILGGVLGVSAAAFIYTLIAYTALWIHRGLSFQLWAAPIQCIDQYRYCPYALTVAEFILLTVLMRILIGCFVLAIIALVSCFCKKSLAVFAVSGGAAAIPMLLAKLLEHNAEGMTVLKRLGLMRLSYLRDYLMRYETVNVCGYPVSQMMLSVLCTVFLTAFVLVTANIFYTHNNTHRKPVKTCSASQT
ncbi:MAG: hypothetical protein IJL32_02360 [Oscillospiraceae bacterium]|nr:hypothetical protein [Oscillospiraceae bacterium]